MKSQTKYDVRSTSRFRRDLKRAVKRGQNVSLLDEIVNKLADGTPLPEKNRDHELSGEWAGHRECHISPDWLLVYLIKDDILVLTLAGTGSHSDIF
ncbi:addiction module toxin, RelE/StbE family [Clostridia bacterium]|nr:addiction module toxin, RelE/StbE family [Clostridia bacterium]